LFLPPRAALAPKGKSRWGLAKATVKIDTNGNKRKQTERNGKIDNWKKDAGSARILSLGKFCPDGAHVITISDRNTA
jgi:hypothetical protein